MKEPLVSIIICTKDRAEVLEKYILRSIPSLRYDNYEVLLVDDASREDIEQIYKRRKTDIPSLRYFRNHKHRNLCYVRNFAIRRARGEIIAFVDDDCVVHEDWLRELVKPFLADEGVMMVGGIQYRRKSDVAIRPGKLVGCNMSFRRGLFDRFLFDDHLKYSHMHDETELMERLRSKDIKIVYNEKAIVRHFQCPAPYRIQGILGWPLNVIYKNAKRISPGAYYSVFLHVFLLGRGESEKSEIATYMRLLRETLFHPDRVDHYIVKGLRRKDALPPRYTFWAKLPFVYYVLLMEIPVLARIGRIQEEKRYRQGARPWNGASLPQEKKDRRR